ncbi:hypothetical protein [Novosphingobium sp. KN65.2]|uniref:hypothetical protein n=1 Tax=Novosphingobium sp. KN65.2 TaxID=1478134 RepID=UPI0012E2719E|nr:hypothetical protein [Novosphingobium sp. KN65.2]
MIQEDHSPSVELVASLRNEAATARRQWATWLGVGSAGGAVALLSFAANLPNPDHALRLLAPAIAAFVAAIILAAPSILALAFELQNAAGHYAAAHNRESLNEAIKRMPLVIASPRSLADEANRERDHYLALANNEDSEAEEYWVWRRRLKWLRVGLMSLSAGCFVFGAIYPIYLIEMNVSFAADHIN